MDCKNREKVYYVDVEEIVKNRSKITTFIHKIKSFFFTNQDSGNKRSFKITVKKWDDNNDKEIKADLSSIIKRLYSFLFILNVLIITSFVTQTNITIIKMIKSGFILILLVYLFFIKNIKDIYKNFLSGFTLKNILSLRNVYYLSLQLISPHRFRYEMKKKLAIIKSTQDKTNSTISSLVSKLIISYNRYELNISIMIFLLFSIFTIINQKCLSYQFDFILLIHILNSSKILLFLKSTLFYILLTIILRTISRSNEIIIAFTQDCFEKKNDSLINSRERIILAISSLSENAFNYTVSYHILSLLKLSDKPLCLWQSFARSFETNFFQNFKLENSLFFPDPLSMLSILQFLTSISLIIFSVAMYASGNKDK